MAGATVLALFDEPNTWRQYYQRHPTSSCWRCTPSASGSRKVQVTLAKADRPDTHHDRTSEYQQTLMDWVTQQHRVVGREGPIDANVAGKTTRGSHTGPGETDALHMDSV